MTDRTLAAGRFLHLVDRDGWEFARRPGVHGVVAVAARTVDGALVVVRQHRPALGGDVVELPAGLWGDVETEESAEAAARRELFEETGFSGGRWCLLHRGPVSAGLTDEIVTLYAADGVERTGSGGGVDGERIAVELWPLPDALARLHAAPCAVDHKVLGAILHWAGRQ